MSQEWTFAQTDPAQQLAMVHYFSVTKREPGDREIEFLITIKEYVTPRDPAMRFLAMADKQTYQKVAAFTPCGWGKTLLDALSDCIRAIHKFPYQGD